MMYDLSAMNFVAGSAQRILDGEDTALMSAFIWDNSPEGWDYWAQRVFFGDMDEEATEKVKQMLAQSEMKGVKIQ